MGDYIKNERTQLLNNSQFQQPTMPRENPFRKPIPRISYEQAHIDAWERRARKAEEEEQRQLSLTPQERENERKLRQEAQEKKDKRNEILRQREKEEDARYSKMVERNQQRREEGKDFGHADHLGIDRLSDVKLNYHSLGYEVRKRMPGFRWEDE
ncbi:MAG: hypothetical protein Q9168_003884 [Polycauliona sp. 1 TL-2023]